MKRTLLARECTRVRHGRLRAGHVSSCKKIK